MTTWSAKDIAPATSITPALSSNGLQKYAYERGGKREQPTRMARMKVTEGRQRYLTGSETHDMFNYFAVHQYYDISNLVRCYLDTGAQVLS